MTNYIAIPRHFSEGRVYFTVDFFAPNVITGDACFTALDPDGYLFALISSSMYITWQRTIGGQLKSDLRFSNTLVWNNFPLPDVSDATRQNIIDAGQKVLEARTLFPGRALEELYNPQAMQPALLEAHAELDRIVDDAFGARGELHTEEERLELLFQRFIELTEAEKKEQEKAAAAKASKKRGTKRTVSARTPKEGADSSIKGSGTEDKGSSHA